MDENSRYSIAIQEQLEKYKHHLEKNELPGLKEKYRLMHTAFKSLWEVLLRKGLIHVDPYKADMRISEISIPPEGHFLESEKTAQISIRMSTYESQLDFLNNYYQFSAEFLDLTRIRLLVGLTKYFNWEQVSEGSANINTKTLAEICGKIKKSGDTLAAGIVTDALDKICRSARQCLDTLKRLAVYHREIYKLEVRLVVVPQLKLVPAQAFDEKEDIVRRVKRHFPTDFPGRPFFPEFILELISEDYGPDSADLHKGVLDQLAVKENISKTIITEPSFSSMLLDALRILSASSRHLEEAIAKLTDNSLLLENRRMPLIERVKHWLRKAAHKEEEPLTYEVEYFDITTSTSKHEKIDFRRFCDETRKKSRLYAGILAKVGSIYKKIEAANDDQLYGFLNKHLGEVNAMHRRLQALDTFFKSEVPREQRTAVRGIKLELTAIRNTLVKANQKKHEYVAKKEEVEQLRRLGVNTNMS